MVNLMTTILIRIPCEKTMSAARAVWVDQEVADDIATNALQILAQASRANLRFFNGKHPKCVLGGLFYILGFRFNAAKTQREIADFLCTTEVSVRKSYHCWLREFPNLFSGVAVKMEAQQSR
jgi:transcription initiation factor TFIIIB Brf1 subunit/transcription initiation factor TFIIB